ncbi:hypothetical protein BURKHO8Y_20030 [Burkholderia sp. 8Y]|nr:hypothetical protein BURKHO8Y_20030 [Burkholderia sp. 8Y]
MQRISEDFPLDWDAIYFVLMHRKNVLVVSRHTWLFCDPAKASPPRHQKTDKIWRHDTMPAHRTG